MSLDEESNALEAQRLILISSSYMSKVEEFELVVLYFEGIFFKVTKNKLGLYTYVLVNRLGFQNTVTIDNSIFMTMLVRSVVVMGFRDVTPDDARREPLSYEDD